MRSKLLLVTFGKDIIRREVMLGRAAGYLENAGWRLFRDPNGAPRGGVSRFWHCNCVDFEYHPWLLALLEMVDQRASYSETASRETERAAKNVKSPPILGFLYPSQMRYFASSLLLRQSRKVAARRRRRLPPGVRRSYSSHTTSVRDQQVDEVGFDPEMISSQRTRAEQRRARHNLIAMLEEQGGSEYGQAWKLYMAAGHPSDFNSQLLAYLSKSIASTDQQRARHLFNKIPQDMRSENDYLHVTKSLLLASDLLGAMEICQEACARDFGASCWTFTFANFAHNMHWQLMIDMFAFRPRGLSPNRLFAYMSPALLTRRAADFATFLRDTSVYREGYGTTPRGLARFFLDYIIERPNVVKHASTGTIFQLLKVYDELHILTTPQYFALIGSLASSDIRSSFVRSLLVYRNFRWKRPSDLPPKELLESLMTRLRSFNMASGVLYMLDEVEHFYGKAPLQDYHIVMNAFARDGDVENVHRVFERFVAVHGPPRRKKDVNPLIYAHSRSGDTKGVLEQFNRLRGEFHLKPDSTSWNILLDAYAWVGDLSRVVSLFEEMLEQGVGPDAYTLRTIMKQYAKKSDIKAVHSLLHMATQREIPITMPLLDTVVEACCNSGQVEFAESLVEGYKNGAVEGSPIVSWNRVLWAYARRVDLVAVSRVRTRMEEIGLRLNGDSYAALMWLLVLVGRPDSARRILRALHRDRQINVTRLHYSIILDGYVRTRNRDMIYIILREFKERFGKFDVRTTLLALRGYIHQDLVNIREIHTGPGKYKASLRRAESFLAQINPQVHDNSELSPKQSHGQIMPASFYKFLIRGYAKLGSREKVEALFDEYKRSRPSQRTPMHLLSELMAAYLKFEKYDKVEEYWTIAFDQAVQMSRLPEIKDVPWPSQHDHDETTQEDTGIISGSVERLPVLPRFRFMLSWHISIYMQSLAYKNQSWKLSQVIEQVESAGFSLTSFNWCTYVQMLSQSGAISDQVKAFVVFEEKFMPNFPGYPAINRSRAVKPADVPETIDLVDKPERRQAKFGLLGEQARFQLSKFRPDFMQPNYVTMVYLASALHSFRERSIAGGTEELRTLYQVAAKTIKAVGRLPNLQDKYQGVLLRRKQERGSDPVSFKPYDPLIWTGGVLGVGGKPRIRHAISRKEQEPVELYEEQTDTGESVQDVDVTGTTEAILPEAKEVIKVEEVDREMLEARDLYDIEMETRLERSKRSGAMSDTEMDDELRVKAEASLKARAQRVEITQQREREKAEREMMARVIAGDAPEAEGEEEDDDEGEQKYTEDEDGDDEEEEDDEQEDDQENEEDEEDEGEVEGEAEYTRKELWERNNQRKERKRRKQMSKRKSRKSN